LYFYRNYENTKSPAHAAKEYFDELYEERFGADWMNYRCALLSPLKKVAVVTDRNENLLSTFASIGAADIMEHFCQRARVLYKMEEKNLEVLNEALYGQSRTELAAEDQYLGDADLTPFFLIESDLLDKNYFLTASFISFYAQAFIKSIFKLESV